MRVFAVLVGLLLGASPAWAANISIVVTGTLFEGGPAFFVEAGRQPVGTGIVAQEGIAQLHSFTVADAVLGDAERVSVRFLNDLYEAGVGDRNLRVLSIAVNGVVFTGEQLRVVAADGQPRPAGLMFGESVTVMVERPEAGWPER